MPSSDVFAFEPLAAATVPRPGAAPAADPVAAARAEAERIRAAAEAEGRAAGFAAGVEQARAEAAASLAVLAAAAEDAARLRGEAAERVEVAAVELALRVAEKVLAGALEADPERVVDVVRGALRRLTERERVVVLVHPADLGPVRGAVDGLVGELGGIEHLEVQAERRMAPGGAVVRTEEGEVDARLETKLERVREVVAEALRP